MVQSRKKSTRRQEYAAAEQLHANGQNAAGEPYPAEGDTSRRNGRPAPAKPSQDGGCQTPTPGPTPPRLNLAHGRLASTLAGTELQWFVDGWFARSMLNVVIGRKNVGKSSCLAWLLAKAEHPVILPGYEESVELMMLPRWRAANVLLRSLLVLNDQHYSPSLQVGLIVSILRNHRADLLVIENLDSYLPPDASTNDSQAVRPYLEALHQIAVQSGVCLVGTRHPGKDPANICPGSHCWEDVPRISVVLESEGNPATRYWMWSHRCGVGRQPAPLAYTLDAKTGQAPVFYLSEQADTAALAMAQLAPDLLDRSRLQTAMDLLSNLLSEDWVETKTVFAEATKEALGEGTMRRAATLLGVQSRREGKGLNHKSYWGRKGLDVPWAESDAP